MDTTRRRVQLRNRHHLWFPASYYRSDPGIQKLRIANCSIVDMWYHAHQAIHGIHRERYATGGLYLPPVLPSRDQLKQFRQQHDRHGNCKHVRRTETVSIFELSSTRNHRLFDHPCADITCDTSMLMLIRECYRPNPAVSPQFWSNRLKARHAREHCTCHFEPNVRHVSVLSTAA